MYILTLLEKRFLVHQQQRILLALTIPVVTQDNLGRLAVAVVFHHYMDGPLKGYRRLSHLTDLTILLLDSEL